MIKKRLFGILLSLALIFGMMPALGMPVYAESEQSEEFTTNTVAEAYTGEHFKISVTDKGDEDGFNLSPPDTATVESLHGEIITKVQFIQGCGNILFFTSQTGTVTYRVDQDIATVSEVNDTRMTVGGSNDPLNIQAVKVYYTEAVNYPLWVDGVQVTSANKDDVLADETNKGKVSYSPAKAKDPAILTLSGATIDECNQDGEDKAGILYTGADPLKIVLAKDTMSSVTNTVDLGIYSSQADIVISGGGALSVTGGPIYSWGDLTIESGSVTVNKTNTSAGAIMGDNVTITGGSVEASAAAKGDGIYAEKNVSISGGTVNASGKSSGIHSMIGDVINITGGSVTAFSTGDNGHAIELGNNKKLSIGECVSIWAGSNETDAAAVTNIETWNHTEKWVKLETTAPIGLIPYLEWDAEKNELVNRTGSDACKNYELVTTGTSGFENGKWYVVNSNVTVKSRIFVSGTAHLILCDNAKLTAEKGINVKDKDKVVDTLNIYAQSTADNAGRLIATGDKNAAGIGGNYYQGGGIISINGGNITATGGREGAGIGGGEDGDGGEITINGGNIEATGGYSGAGIGGGLNAYGDIGGDGGSITINGGTVNAIGGAHGAGIGGGSGGDGGSITINGGLITATGCRSDYDNYGGAGIGGGVAGEGGTVAINSGIVTAIGGGTFNPKEYFPAVGIGRGETEDDLSNGTLTVGDGLYVYGGNSANPTTEIKRCRGQNPTNTLTLL